MSTMYQSLPMPLESKIVYDALQIENPTYDPAARRYRVRVYGQCKGTVMPLIIVTAVAVRKIEDVEITDEEIDAIQAEKPELTDRIAAAMARAFERLYALANEKA